MTWCSRRGTVWLSLYRTSSTSHRVPGEQYAPSLLPKTSLGPEPRVGYSPSLSLFCPQALGSNAGTADLNDDCGLPAETSHFSPPHSVGGPAAISTWPAHDPHLSKPVAVERGWQQCCDIGVGLVWLALSLLSACMRAEGYRASFSCSLLLLPCHSRVEGLCGGGRKGSE